MSPWPRRRTWSPWCEGTLLHVEIRRLGRSSGVDQNLDSRKPYLLYVAPRFAARLIGASFAHSHRGVARAITRCGTSGAEPPSAGWIPRGSPACGGVCLPRLVTTRGAALGLFDAEGGVVPPAASGRHLCAGTRQSLSFVRCLRCSCMPKPAPTTNILSMCGNLRKHKRSIRTNHDGRIDHISHHLPIVSFSCMILPLGTMLEKLVPRGTAQVAKLSSKTA